MKKHSVEVDGFDGNLEELAQAVFGMRYDRVVDFLEHAGKELRRQSEGDKGRGRMKLSKLLSDAEQKTKELQEIMEEIFLICKPFMKHELD